MPNSDLTNVKKQFFFYPVNLSIVPIDNFLIKATTGIKMSLKNLIKKIKTEVLWVYFLL